MSTRQDIYRMAFVFAVINVLCLLPVVIAKLPGLGSFIFFWFLAGAIAVVAILIWLLIAVMMIVIYFISLMYSPYASPRYTGEQPSPYKIALTAVIGVAAFSFNLPLYTKVSALMFARSISCTIPQPYQQPPFTPCIHWGVDWAGTLKRMIDWSEALFQLSPAVASVCVLGLLLLIAGLHVLDRAAPRPQKGGSNAPSE